MVRSTLVSLVLAALMAAQAATLEAVEEPLPGPGDLPSFLVTTNTKQVYRFHFSGLQSADAVRLAGQIWPIVAKLPAKNPLRKAVLQAKDVASFADDYRSLRSAFMEAGIDTIYFLAEDHWIEAATLPGYVVLPGTKATLGRLHKRLKAAGHTDWATSLEGFQPADAPGWMVATEGSVTSSGPSQAKAALVEHALQESCPIKPASVSTRNLPELQVNLNDTMPLTIVNLERNQLDAVLGQVLPALVPAAARTVELSEKAEAATISVAVYPFPFVRQVAHMTNRNAAQALSNEINKSINGSVQRAVDLDSDFGPLLGMFAQSMVMVSTQGNDVVLVMKPPLLFDLDLAQRTAREAQEQDWTALPAPAGYHWECIGALGTTIRNDVLARVAGVRVRGGRAVAPEKSDKPAKSAGGSASFRVPVKEYTLTLTRDLRGNLKIDPPGKGEKPPILPALELLDDRGRVAAVLRLDLGPGDPRFDLARTQALLRKRLAERTAAEKLAKKELDEVEDSHQKALLEKKALNQFAEWEEKLDEKARPLGYHRAALGLYQELDKKVAALQHRYPGTTLVEDGSETAAAENPFAARQKLFPFAGQWLFDHGMLTLHQDTKKIVAGTFTCKPFRPSGRFEIDSQREAAQTAIVSGQVARSTLKFTMLDIRRRERTGKIILDADGLGGSWSLDATTRDDIDKTMKNRKETKNSPVKYLSDPVRRTIRDYEPRRHGRLDRLDTGSPEAAWFQDVATGSFEGYWVHATNKANNTLLKAIRPGLFEGSNGGGVAVGGGGNLKAAAAGNVLFILQNPGDIIASSVREAVLSADGQGLTIDPVTEDALRGRLFQTDQKGVELTKGKE